MNTPRSEQCADQWIKTGRELTIDVIKKCKTDSILTYQLETLIKHVDSDISVGKNFGHRIDDLLNVMGKDLYYERFRDNAEEKQIRGLKDQFNQLSKFANYDMRANDQYDREHPVEVIAPTRLPQGESKSYAPTGARQRL